MYNNGNFSAMASLNKICKSIITRDYRNDSKLGIDYHAYKKAGRDVDIEERNTYFIKDIGTPITSWLVGSN